MSNEITIWRRVIWAGETGAEACIDTKPDGKRCINLTLPESDDLDPASAYDLAQCILAACQEIEREPHPEGPPAPSP